jgi:heavy metal sensor kinase
MIFRSIKWRLQLWYGAILVVVLVGFGITAYQLERGRQFRRIDEELHRRASAIANVLRPPPRRGPGAGEPPFGRPPPGQSRFDQPLDNHPPEREPQPLRVFHLPPQLARLFDTGDTNGFYYVISRDSGELSRSANAPRRELIGAPDKHSVISVNTVPPLRFNPSERQPARMRHEFREVIAATPGETILVGRRIAVELAELRQVAWGLTGVGSVVLLLGLAGGWWIATRAIHPITDISAAAVKIAAGDLSQRINVADTDNELGRLAGVLNSTFVRLEAAFAQQGRFTSDAAHELRTPIAVLLTQTQTALSRERNSTEYRETLEACQRAAQRMRRLIESLLELARFDAGQEMIKRLPFDLARIAQDCVEQVRPLAEQRGVSIVVELPALECEGDSERLAQVITNLLTNAIQHNPGGCEVRVRTQNENGTAVLSVTDAGRGIPESDMPHIFERFYRADKSRSGSSGNAGLGLAISRAIVEAHGGTIEVSSQLGAGTTFTIRLPAAPSR